MASYWLTSFLNYAVSWILSESVVFEKLWTHVSLENFAHLANVSVASLGTASSFLTFVYRQLAKENHEAKRDNT